MTFTIEQVEQKLQEIDTHIAPYLQARAQLRTFLTQMRAAEFPMWPDDQLVAQYVHDRDVEGKPLEGWARREDKVVYEPVDNEMGLIGAELGRRLTERGAENTKTAHGTAFWNTRLSVKTEDKSQFSRWVIGGEKWEFADIRPVKEAVEDFMAAQVGDDTPPEPPPGLTVEHVRKVHVRKS